MLSLGSRSSRMLNVYFQSDLTTIACAIAHLVVNLIQDNIRNEENEIDDQPGVSDGSQKRSDNKMSVAHYQQPHLFRIKKLQSS
jgi:hypothetical protein